MYNEAEVHMYYLQSLRQSALWGSLEVTQEEVESLEKIRVEMDTEGVQLAEADLTCTDI